MASYRTICFVSFFAYPLFNAESKVTFGGSEVQLFNIANELSKNAKLEISFIVGDYSKSIPSINLFGRIKVFKLFNLSKNNLIYKLLYSARLLYYLININADVYIKRSAGPEVGIIAFYCKLFHKKFIYMTAHEIDCSGEYRRNNNFLGFLFEFGLKHADIVITQNKEHNKLLESIYGTKSVILNNGYTIPEKEARERRCILWVARLDRWKQPEIFLDIARSFPSENFIMIAPLSGDREYAQKIQHDVLKIGNVRFFPGVNFSKINLYFKSAKIFINTSRYEGFPNTFIQATMNGVPIVSLSVNPDSFIEKNKIGYCANGKLDEFKKKLNLLLNNCELYNISSDNAYDYAVKNHDIQDVSAKFVQIIQSIYAR